MFNKRLIFLVIASLLALVPFSFSYAEDTHSLLDELLKDPGFHLGYTVMSPQKDIFTDSAEKEAIHRLNDSDKEPAWRLVQWGSSSSLADVKPIQLDGGAKKWEYSSKDSFYKSVVLTPEGEVELMLNGLAEFSSIFYSDNKELYLQSLEFEWPHLLLAQNIKSKKLNNYRKITLSFDAKLLFDHKNIREGYNSGLHAARFPIAIAVRNTLSNNTFWLILVVYDDRYASSGFNCLKCNEDESGTELCEIPDSVTGAGRWECPFDGSRWSADSEKKGTRKMLFRVPTSAFAQGNIQQGEWVHYQMDLLPYVQAAVDAARQTKKLAGFSKDLRFYDLTFYSMGWEINGLNQAAIAIKNLSLNATSLENRAAQ